MDNTLFNLEGTQQSTEMYGIGKWGYSSAGRAPALQAGGQRFDPVYLHQESNITSVFTRRAHSSAG